MAFDEIGLDVLREIGNIGASNATTSLSSMLGSDISMKVPSCKMVSFSELSNIFENGPETIAAAVLAQMNGDMQGFVMLIQSVEDAAELVSKLTGEKIDLNEDLSKMLEDLSPVEEIANIMIGSYLHAISKMTGFSITPSVLELHIDMALAIMNVPALVYGEVGEEVLLMDTEFDGGLTGGRFLLIPTVESYNNLMKALGM